MANPLATITDWLNSGEYSSDKVVRIGEGCTIDEE